MKGYVELLKEDPGNERYLGIVERNLDRLIALTSDISSLSRLENVEPEFGVVDVSELQHDLTELFQHQAQATGIPLVFSIADDARFVRGDKLMLLQLFINLIENSYRFTERGRIDVSATVDGDAVVFVVRDTGVGIPEQQIPRIFERFYSRDRLHGRTGTGLGLAIAKRVVLAHGGTIAADSPRGAGAAFTIRIPRGAHSAMQTTSKNRLKEDS
jgi:signal transduction histidine kinase